MTSKDADVEAGTGEQPSEEVPSPEDLEAEPPAPPEIEPLDEDYDDLVGPEPAPKKPRKKRRYGGIIVVSIVLIFLLVWTVMAPENMPVVGSGYLSSDQYANLGNFSGSVKTWATNTTYGVSISGPDTAAANSTVEITVLVTKVAETRMNTFVQGTSIDLDNVSIYIDDGSDTGILVASMSDHEDVGFGIAATVPLTFSEEGSYSLYVHVEFTMFGDMMIGFLPLKGVNIDDMNFDEDFVVTPAV